MYYTEADILVAWEHVPWLWGVLCENRCVFAGCEVTVGPQNKACLSSSPPAAQAWVIVSNEVSQKGIWSVIGCRSFVLGGDLGQHFEKVNLTSSSQVAHTDQ